MFWQEDEDKNLPYEVPNDITDISFTINCKQLPIDHIDALSQGIQQCLPWVSEEPHVGIHPIHVAESGNGWHRPDNDAEQLLYPSRRTRLTLRIPQHRIADAKKLTGQTMVINDHPLTFDKVKLKPLINASVIFSRYIVSPETETEDAFLTRMAQDIKQLTDVTVRKMMCGQSHNIKQGQNIIHTRHLMIADLDNEPSITLQQVGLGEGRLLGCGLFLPHKGIKSLHSAE